MSRTIKDSKKAPLCKGGWIFAKQKDWGIVKCRQPTIPPSKIKDFCHLPLLDCTKLCRQHKKPLMVGNI